MRLWSQTGNVKAIDKALAKLDLDAELWSSIIRYVKSAYQEQQRDVMGFLHELNKKLPHPNSKSAVRYFLGNEYLEKGNNDRAIEYFRQVVNTNADSFYVEQSLNGLNEIEKLKVGTKAPNFTAKTIEGNSITLSNLRGKAVVLAFWATWCGPL